MVGVGYNANRSHTGSQYQTHLARRQFQRYILTLTGNQLRISTTASGHSGSSAWLQFDIVNKGTQWNVSQLHRITDLRSHTLTRHQGLSYLNPFRSNNIRLRTIHIEEQGQTGRSIGVVFNSIYYRRYAVFVSLEINYSQSPLMSTTQVPGGHFS